MVEPDSEIDVRNAGGLVRHGGGVADPSNCVLAARVRQPAVVDLAGPRLPAVRAPHPAGAVRRRGGAPRGGALEPRDEEQVVVVGEGLAHELDHAALGRPGEELGLPPEPPDRPLVRVIAVGE